MSKFFTTEEREVLRKAIAETLGEGDFALQLELDITEGEFGPQKPCLYVSLVGNDGKRSVKEITDHKLIAEVLLVAGTSIKLADNAHQHDEIKTKTNKTK